EAPGRVADGDAGEEDPPLEVPEALGLQAAEAAPRRRERVEDGAPGREPQRAREAPSPSCHRITVREEQDRSQDLTEPFMGGSGTVPARLPGRNAPRSSTSSRGSTGFTRWPSKPASIVRRRSSF